MKNLTVGGCRIPVTRHVADNLVEIKKAIDWAAENAVELMSTPECALSGYMWRAGSPDDKEVAQINEAIEELKTYSLAKKVDLVLGTAKYNENGNWANMQLFIINGEVAHTTAKRVTFGEEHKLYEAGTETTLLEYKGYKIAGLICNDYWSNPVMFPDASGSILRDLKKNGCNLVIVSANVPKWPGPENIMYDWHKSWTAMIGTYGRWATVICDSSVTIEGLPYDDKWPCPAGICKPAARWELAKDIEAIAYYKATLHLDLANPAGPLYY